MNGRWIYLEVELRWSEEQLQEYKAKRRGVAAAPASKSVIRQSRKGMNKTERRFLDEHLKPLVACGYLDEIGEHESITLKLANGVRLSPDFPTWAGGRLTFYEVKGGRIWEDSLIKLKMAASKHPHFRFILCKYSKGEWIKQEVLP